MRIVGKKHVTNGIFELFVRSELFPFVGAFPMKRLIVPYLLESLQKKC